MGCIVQQYVRERNCTCPKKKNMLHVLSVSMCVCLESCLCLTCVNVFLSLNRQELPTVAPPTPIHHCRRHYPYLCLTRRHFFPWIGDFFFPLFTFKSVLPQTSQIGWRYQSGESAKMRQAPHGLYCPPVRLCNGRTGTAGGSRHSRRLLRILGPLQRPYSGTALILQTQRGKG